MEKEIKEYAEKLIKEKLAKAMKKEEEAKPETKFDESLFKGFSLGSSLVEENGRVILGNTREHNAERDLAKAYAHKKTK